MKGKSIDEVIAQGKKNLERMDQGAGRTAGQVPGNKLTTAEQSAYKAGGGNAAAMKGRSIDEVIAQGRKNLKRMDQGSGRVGSSLTQPAPQRSSNR
jgi:ribosomal protein L12E/L44/L45/RPP1/RPP2